MDIIQSNVIHYTIQNFRDSKIVLTNKDTFTIVIGLQKIRFQINASLLTM